jgi:hypothetical protein
MKWQALVAAMLAVAAAGPVGAEEMQDWQIAYIGKDGGWAYRVDLLNPAQLYVATRFAKPQRLGDGGNYSGDEKVYELDCAHSRTRIMGVAHFEADGSLIDDDPVSGDWLTFKPSGGNFDVGALMAAKCAGNLPKSPAEIHAGRTGLQQFLGASIK